MGCFLVLFALISPRLALFFMLIFSDLLGRAFDEWWLPFIGFFLLPWTTLVYALMWAAGPNGVEGFEIFFVILAFLVDVSSWAGGNSQRDERGR